MTPTQRAAMQSALDVLEKLQGGCTDNNDGTVEAITVWCPEIIDALAAALAEPAPPADVPMIEQKAVEPVGFVNRAAVNSAIIDRARGVGDTHTWSEKKTSFHSVPFYTSPQPAPAQEPTRFDIDMDGSMEPSEFGAWVRYEDI